MNTAVRSISENRFQPTLPSIQIKRPKLINMVLIGILLLSAFSVIYIKDLNRRLFIQYQALQATHDKLYQDWGKLLLEQSTWSTQARVQKIAQYRLGMNSPSSKEIKILRR
ncbi:MAG: cell division protein FtsL [Gammaproteobacteria bacterium]|nr:cell division protein FtsL [Gammaproteobacteria bacterium]